jgi:hypothetical protein
MTMTRREVLTVSGGALIGSAACASTGQERPHVHPETSQLLSVTADDAPHIAVRFEGMFATILTALKSDPKPVAVDFALMDVLAEGDKDIVDRHVPTLAVPRRLLKGTPTVEADIVDGHAAYWLLRGRNLEIVSTSANPLVVDESTAALTPEQIEPLDLKKDWDSLRWVADMNSLYPGRAILDNWRQQRFVNTVVRISAGGELEPAMESFVNEDRPIGYYELQTTNGASRPKRVYKHFVRARVRAAGDVRVEITSRTAGGPGGSITLSAAGGTEHFREIRISNLPIVWRPREADKIQVDTRTFGALFGVPANDRFVSKYKGAVNNGRSDGCDCCVPPRARQALSVDTLPPLKDA